MPPRKVRIVSGPVAESPVKEVKEVAASTWPQGHLYQLRHSSFGALIARLLESDERNIVMRVQFKSPRSLLGIRAVLGEVRPRGIVHRHEVLHRLQAQVPQSGYSSMVVRMDPTNGRAVFFFPHDADALTDVQVWSVPATFDAVDSVLAKLEPSVQAIGLVRSPRLAAALPVTPFQTYAQWEALSKH